jgi:hypothetical protein
MVIDHITTSIPAECYYTEVINSLLSDNFAQCININLTVPQQMRCYKETRNLAEANITGLCSLIQIEPWSVVFWEKDINKKWDTFYTTFNYYFNIACPKLRRNITRTVKARWINKDIVIAKNQLKDLYNIYRLSATRL